MCQVEHGSLKFCKEDSEEMALLCSLHVRFILFWVTRSDQYAPFFGALCTDHHTVESGARNAMCALQDEFICHVVVKSTFIEWLCLNQLFGPSLVDMTRGFWVLHWRHKTLGNSSKEPCNHVFSPLILQLRIDNECEDMIEHDNDNLRTVILCKKIQKQNMKWHWWRTQISRSNETPWPKWINRYQSFTKAQKASSTDCTPDYTWFFTRGSHWSQGDQWLQHDAAFQEVPKV